jgi:hypothetical protein
MQANTRHALTFVALCGSLAATSAMADHNSVWGAGTANMPNDIHNAQIEGTTSDGTIIEDWSAFVSKGAGAATVNRYLDSDATLPSETAMTGGVDRAAQVTRGGRPEVSGSVGMRAMNVSIERPAMTSRGGRR